MLHNTGPYGPNDPPVNMGASVNIPDLSDPVNLAQNLTHLVKMSQQASHSSVGHFNFQNYAGFTGPSLSNNAQIHNFQHHNNFDGQASSTSVNTSIPLNATRQNGVIPEPLNFNAAHTQSFLENPFLHKFNHINQSAGLTPQSMTEVVDKKPFDTNADSNSQESIEESQLVNKKKEHSFLSNILNNSRHITIAFEREKMYKDQKLMLNDANSINNKVHDTEDTKEFIVNSITKDTVENSEHTKPDVVLEFSSKEPQGLDPEDVVPLSLTRLIKQEPVDEPESVVVKIEQVSSWTDTDHMQPFHKDSNGMLRENSSHSNIINCESSVAAATEVIQNGTSSDAYFECPNCCLLFSHPKRFLVHVKWHTFGLHNEKRLEEAQEKMERRRQKTLAARKIEEAKKVEIKQEEAKVQAQPLKEPETYDCALCDKTFSNKTSLKNHRHKFHPTTEHQCKVCQKVVLGWFGLKTHMLTHSTETEFQCNECPKKYKNAHSLAKHRDTHLEKTQACPQCPKKFGSQNLLKMHMRTHERMQRGPTFSCSYCAKGFYESYNLQVHERTHRNERPYQCEICKTSYGTTSSLKRHLKVSHTHSSAKPFECATCHRCFVSALIRDRHAARDHGTPGALQHACTKCTCRYLRQKDLQRHMYRMHPKGKKRRKHSESDSE